MVDVGGDTIAVRVLPGYCNEFDRDFFSPLERSDPSRYVIAVSASCPDLTAFKSGSAARFLEQHDLTKAIFTAIGGLLEARGLLLRSGTIVDATIIAAPS